MRTIGFVLASLLVSTVAFADDNVSPRNQPASPETNDADFASTRFETAYIQQDTAPPSDSPITDRYIPISGAYLSLNDPGTCDGIRMRCDAQTALTLVSDVAQGQHLDPALSEQRVVIRDTKLHLAPSFDGVEMWARF
jgi:hypothetical protein